jgi:hypothetical protein
MAERLGCSQNLLRTVQGRIAAEVIAQWSFLYSEWFWFVVLLSGA